MATVSASPLLDHIDAVLSAHYRLTGKRLDWREAVRRLDRFAAIGGDDMDFMPAKTWEVLVGCTLIGGGYSEPAIRRILAHCHKYQTPNHCPDLDESDIDAIAELLPRHFSLVATTAEEGDECLDGDLSHSASASHSW